MHILGCAFWFENYTLYAYDNLVILSYLLRGYTKCLNSTSCFVYTYEVVADIVNRLIETISHAWILVWDCLETVLKPSLYMPRYQWDGLRDQQRPVCLGLVVCVINRWDSSRQVEKNNAITWKYCWRTDQNYSSYSITGHTLGRYTKKSSMINERIHTNFLLYEISKYFDQLWKSNANLDILIKWKILEEVKIGPYAVDWCSETPHGSR